jgi:hypothetical protein
MNRLSNSNIQNSIAVAFIIPHLHHEIQPLRANVNFTLLPSPFFFLDINFCYGKQNTV